MGTAPGQQHPIAMPDPHRTVSRSVGVLENEGYNRQAALCTVVKAARSAIAILTGAGVRETGWLGAIALDATSRIRRLNPHEADREEASNGNGTGSSAGSTEENRERR